MKPSRSLLDQIRELTASRKLTKDARDAAATDKLGLPAADPGCSRVIEEGLDWLARAQDLSASQDGGVARHYSLISGWAPSYPETTGYIIPTLLEFGNAHRPDLVERARRMLDWLVAVQLKDGGFQGGVIGASPVVPVAFNTGQILIGLAAGQRAFGTYMDPLRRAADWLVAIQDDDGCWRRGASPFAEPGDKTYDTHIAWGLLEAARLLPEAGYGDAALRNIRWALKHQHANGWIDHCCLSIPKAPLTHTLGYAVRGLIESYLFSGLSDLLSAAQRSADGMLAALQSDGVIPGRLNHRWQPAAHWVCVTGSSQIAHCWLQLYEITGDERYLSAAKRVNRWVRRTIATEGPVETRGGVKGSFPVDGGYGTFEFLNWACKFTIDANILELKITNKNEAGFDLQQNHPHS
jgi:hypothetical protein